MGTICSAKRPLTHRVLPATRFDLKHLAAHMRQDDVIETQCNAIATGRHSDGWSPLADLLLQYSQGFEAWSYWRGDELVVVGGCEPIKGDPYGRGAIWLLGTDLADKYPKDVTKIAKAFINLSLKAYPAVGNILPKSMTKRKRWLEFLGFDFFEFYGNPRFTDHVIFWSQGKTRPQ